MQGSRYGRKNFRTPNPGPRLLISSDIHHFGESGDLENFFQVVGRIFDTEVFVSGEFAMKQAQPQKRRSHIPRSGEIENDLVPIPALQESGDAVFQFRFEDGADIRTEVAGKTATECVT